MSPITTETGQESTAGLNRDVSEAYEITKDEEGRTDLYVSQSSVDAVSDPAATFQQWKGSVENYGESSEEALANVGKLIVTGSSLAAGNSVEEVQQQLRVLEALRQLNKGDAEQKAAAARSLVGNITGDAGAAENQAVANRIAQLAEQNPEKALQAVALLATLQNPQNGIQQNFAQVLGLAVAGGLGAVLLSTAATPANQQSMREAANALMEAAAKTGANAQDQLRLSAELWTLVVGTAFPIHTLDPKYGPLVNPIVDLKGENPASGGYAEGGRIITTPHTGGNQLDGQQGGTSYTNPEHQLNPGNMYSEGVELKGLAQNRPLQDLTHQELVKVFEGSGFVLSNHAVTRLKDPRTKNIGFNTPNDIVRIFNNGARFDAGNGEIGYSYRGLEAIVDPETKRVVTFRPEKNRGGR